MGELVGLGSGSGGTIGGLRGNYWKEVDPETAVCRLRKAAARLGETAAPCGCRNGGLETAAPCLIPVGLKGVSVKRHCLRGAGTNEHCLPDAGLIDMPFPFPVRATETAGRSLGKSFIW